MKDRERLTTRLLAKTRRIAVDVERSVDQPIWRKSSVRHIDIPILAKYFAEKLATVNGLTNRKFTNEALTFLQSMSWPGNIRQLRNVIERVLILGDPSDEITSDELILSEEKAQDTGKKNSLISSDLASMSLREAREVFERDYLVLQINRFGGNISKTAAFIEMERSALHRKLKSLGINSGQKINQDASN